MNIQRVKFFSPHPVRLCSNFSCGRRCQVNNFEFKFPECKCLDNLTLNGLVNKAMKYVFKMLNKEGPFNPVKRKYIENNFPWPLRLATV